MNSFQLFISFVCWFIARFNNFIPRSPIHSVIPWVRYNDMDKSKCVPFLFFIYLIVISTAFAFQRHVVITAATICSSSRSSSSFLLVVVENSVVGDY
mmetsp:Transcript_15988/g.17274  ORF Transcript_15988/g.17274 Transcript_15988/m.17274 type:complete len:97 (-) Transcript_15988:86-376(-)